MKTDRKKSLLLARAELLQERLATGLRGAVMASLALAKLRFALCLVKQNSVEPQSPAGSGDCFGPKERVFAVALAGLVKALAARGLWPLPGAAVQLTGACSRYNLEGVVKSDPTATEPEHFINLHALMP